MLIIGLTGGIGSGKTAASDYLATKGVTVVDADLASREVVKPGRPALAAIAERFGERLLNHDGTLDRAALRALVFSDPQALKDLEGITHPAIREEILRQLRASTSPYTVLVSPLLLETDQHELVDRILLIDAPEEAQLERTMQRDRVAAAQVEAIMAAQMQRAARQAKADDVVVNDGSLSDLHGRLDLIHEKYLRLAQP